MKERFENQPQVKGNPLPMHESGRGRFPKWLHRKLPKGEALWETSQVVESNRLATVCEEARCPNRLECWSQKTATFLAMGKACTRACGFCDIDTQAHPPPLEADEPERVAASVKALGLRHVVITMVARDDQPLGGADHVAAIVAAVRRECPGVTVELLTSDFEGDRKALDRIIEAAPEVFNHNIETIRRLTPSVRHKATYDRSLEVLRYMQGHTPHLKSGLMVGLGETPEEVEAALRDLKAVGCDRVTIGQYLQPNWKKLRVKSFVTPEQFEAYAEYGRSIGIPGMFCGPFVRSSYHAGEWV